jgi:B12-binding domain/radical SAM domain protein
MRVNWRWHSSAKNSFAVLHAACQEHGFYLNPVLRASEDITCFHLNSINVSDIEEEIASASCITIVGGPHATSSWKELIKVADYVVVGEGEYALPALLTSIEKGTDSLPDGIATRDRYEPARYNIRLDAYPPFSDYLGYIEITRGCPHACGYCQTPRIFGCTMRHRSIDEIARYAARLSDVRFVTPNALAYGSDGITSRLDRVKALLCRIPNRCWFGTFPSEIRPEFITDEAMELISTYCTNTVIHFGAQSGSDRVLHALHRGHCIDDVFMAAETCLDHGFQPVVDVILGLPCEDDGDQQATIRLVRWITGHGGKVHAHRFLPLPGTPLSHAKARPILPEAERVLGMLALKGDVSGSWSSPEIRFFRTPPNDIT